MCNDVFVKINLKNIYFQITTEAPCECRELFFLGTKKKGRKI